MVFGGEAKGQCFGNQRIYATAQTNSNAGGFLGNNDVTNPQLAVGNDLTDFSTISIPSLGITRFQKLSFGQSFTNSEAIHVKLSSSVNLALLQVTIEVQAYNGGSPSGTKVTLSSGALLNLLSGANIADIVITDPGATYDAVQITIIGAVVSSGSMNIYAAYVSKPQTVSINCESIEDILTGSTSGALGALNGVTSPNNAIDADLNSYAVINQNIGAAGYVHLTTLYSSPSAPGDSIKVLLSIPGVPLLDANVFSKLSVVAYNGNTAVATIPASSALLGIRLLDATNHIYQFTYPVNSSFDRISVQAGGLVGALTSVYVHDIKRIIPKPTIKIDNATLTSKTICFGENTTLSIANTQNCTNYEWYDAATGGNLLFTGTSFIRNALTANTYKYYVQAVRQGCTTTVSERVPVTIIVNASPVATISGTTSVCLNAAAPSITFTGSSGTAPYTFTYLINSGTPQTITTVTGNSITITAPTSSTGAFAYQLVSVKDNSATQCSNTITGQAATVTVNPLPMATISGTTSVCLNATAPTITFTGSGSTAPYTFSYKIGSGSVQTVISNAAGVANVSIPTSTTGTFVYNLISIEDSSATHCAQLQSGFATITILPKPQVPQMTFNTF